MVKISGKIDVDGFLEISRHGNMVPVQCPFGIDKEIEGKMMGTGCGHWCALFGEPHEIEPTIDRGQKITNTKLSLCKKDLIFIEFLDDRVTL